MKASVADKHEAGEIQDVVEAKRWRLDFVVRVRRSAHEAVAERHGHQQAEDRQDRDVTEIGDVVAERPHRVRRRRRRRRCRGARSARRTARSDRGERSRTGCACCASVMTPACLPAIEPVEGGHAGAEQPISVSRRRCCRPTSRTPRAGRPGCRGTCRRRQSPPTLRPRRGCAWSSAPSGLRRPAPLPSAARSRRGCPCRC